MSERHSRLERRVEVCITEFRRLAACVKHAPSQTPKEREKMCSHVEFAITRLVDDLESQAKLDRRVKKAIILFFWAFTVFFWVSIAIVVKEVFS